MAQFNILAKEALDKRKTDFLQDKTNSKSNNNKT